MTLHRTDPLKAEQSRLKLYADLHREAGKRGYYCTPAVSRISGKWQAEINAHSGRMNVKLGTGDTPLLAAVDGYFQLMKDPIMLTYYAECYAYEAGPDGSTLRVLEVSLAVLTKIIADV